MGGQAADWSFWLIVIVAMGAFMFLPQIMARRRQKKREEELKVGDRVITIGGFIGELTYLSFEGNLAKIKVADGVEMQLVPGAIRGSHPEPSADVAEDAEGESGDDEG